MFTCACSVTQSCLTLCDPMDRSLPGSSVHGFSRPEYWSGLPFPSHTCLMTCEIKAVILSTFCAYDIESLHVFYVTPMVPCVTTRPPIQHKVLFISSFSVLLKYLFFKIFIWLHQVFWDSDGSDGKKICLQCRRPRFDLWVGKIPWRREWLPTLVFSPGESMDRGAWQATQSMGSQESDTTE